MVHIASFHLYLNFLFVKQFHFESLPKSFWRLEVLTFRGCLTRRRDKCETGCWEDPAGEGHHTSDDYNRLGSPAFFWAPAQKLLLVPYLVGSSWSMAVSGPLHYTLMLGISKCCNSQAKSGLILGFLLARCASFQSHVCFWFLSKFVSQSGVNYLPFENNDTGLALEQMDGEDLFIPLCLSIICARWSLAAWTAALAPQRRTTSSDPFCTAATAAITANIAKTASGKHAKSVSWFVS